MRLVIADDHFAVRECIRDLVATEHEVLAAFENCESLLDHLANLAADVALLDISMPAMGGFILAQRILRDFPTIKIIFVSQHVERDYIDRAFLIGASGYVLKRAVFTDLLPAIRLVSAGNLFLSPHLGGDSR